MPRTPGAPRPKRPATQRARRRRPEQPQGAGSAAQQGSIPAGLAPLAPPWAPLGAGSPHPMAPAHPGDLAAPADPAAMPMRDS